MGSYFSMLVTGRLQHFFSLFINFSGEKKPPLGSSTASQLCSNCTYYKLSKLLPIVYVSPFRLDFHVHKDTSLPTYLRTKTKYLYKRCYMRQSAIKRIHTLVETHPSAMRRIPFHAHAIFPLRSFSSERNLENTLQAFGLASGFASVLFQSLVVSILILV